MQKRIEFQAEVEWLGKTRIIDVVAYGAVTENACRVALVEWMPNIDLDEAQKSHLMRSARASMGAE